MFVNGFQSYMVYISKPPVSVPSAGKPAWMEHVSIVADDLCAVELDWGIQTIANTQQLIAPVLVPSCASPRSSQCLQDAWSWDVNTVHGLGRGFQLACCPMSNSPSLIFFRSWDYVLILTSRLGEKPGDLMVEETEHCAWVCLVLAVWLSGPVALRSTLAGRASVLSSAKRG